MELIDTHCHLDFFGDDLPEILNHANQAMVTSIISCGTEVNDWKLHHKIANQYKNVHYTVGIHPNNITENWENDLEILESYFTKNIKPIAVGEIGLDYNKIGNDAQNIINLQKIVFTQQLKIASKYDIPIVVHSRDAIDDCQKIIDQSGCDWNKIVVHCFSEGPQHIKEINSRGGRGSFTGIITYKNAENIRQSLLAQRFEYLMLETDSPFLAPVPFRSKKNEPAFLREIAKFAASIFNISETELSQITTKNVREFFKLP